MGRRNQVQLENFLEKVAYEGYGVESKEFFLLAYGRKQKNFTIAVREFISEEWDGITEEIKSEIKVDLTDVELKFGDMPRDRILVIRDGLLWDDYEDEDEDEDEDE